LNSIAGEKNSEINRESRLDQSSEKRSPRSPPFFSGGKKGVKWARA